MSALRSQAAVFYSGDARSLWDMTAYELEEIIGTGHRKAACRAAENELLAFNIGALVLSAFNAPSRFPKTPAEAFGHDTAPPADGGKNCFMAVAEQLNTRLKHASERLTLQQKTGDDHDCRRT